jgi:chemosensory pili system protein ChpA (sensor histidine kinase/response regulator)
MAAKNALIIDDDISILRICSGVLYKEGFNVVTAKTGMGAFEELYKNPFDLIITSLGMKAKNGFTVLGMVRALSPRTPLIVFAGNECSVACQFLPLLEPCAFLGKPCSDEMLASFVKGPLINGNNGRGRTLEAL